MCVCVSGKEMKGRCQRNRKIRVERAKSDQRLEPSHLKLMGDMLARMYLSVFSIM